MNIDTQNNNLFKNIFFCVLTFLSCICATGQRSEKMNVVFIVADDLGWSDTELYGTTGLYKTPNILKLAKRGMTFTRAYTNSPVCSPTRASILTGQDVFRHGSTQADHHIIYNKKNEAKLDKKIRTKPINTTYQKANRTKKKEFLLHVSANRLDSKLPTLGQVFVKNGYETAHFGKWHLGDDAHPKIKASQMAHGFDYVVPKINSPGPIGGYFDDSGQDWKKLPEMTRFKRDKTKKTTEVEPFNINRKGDKKGKDPIHLDIALANEASHWLKKIRNKSKPFFLNFWAYSVHTPLNATKTKISAFQNTVNTQNTGAQKSATYAAMINELDTSIGVLVQALEDEELLENTIIIFTSDNGGNVQIKASLNPLEQDTKKVAITSNFPLRGGKATLYEGGVRVPAIIIWPSVTKGKTISNEMIQTSDFYPTFMEELNLKLPKPYNNVDRSIKNNYPIDGANIMPALKEKELDRNEIYTYYPVVPPVNKNVTFGPVNGPAIAINYKHIKDNSVTYYKYFRIWQVDINTDTNSNKCVALGYTSKLFKINNQYSSYDSNFLFSDTEEYQCFNPKATKENKKPCGNQEDTKDLLSSNPVDKETAAIALKLNKLMDAYILDKKGLLPEINRNWLPIKSIQSCSKNTLSKK